MLAYQVESPLEVPLSWQEAAVHQVKFLGEVLQDEWVEDVNSLQREPLQMDDGLLILALHHD